MNTKNSLKAVEGAVPLSTDPSKTPPKTPRATSGKRAIFVGRKGLRAGWRLLIFLVLLGIPVGGLLIASHGQIRPPKEMAITPFLIGVNDAILLLIVGVATWIMGRIEHRKFGEYGLPMRQALRKDFWFGSVLGFAAISGTLLTMFLLHGFRITGLAVHGRTILFSLGGWGIAYLLSGLFEEFAFRGYVQYTLASGIGFWPAALVLSGLFGIGHLIADANENVVGSVTVVMFGLLLCLFLRRTGNLWCAVGFHAAYDWGQMLYGVPDSGIVPYHNLLNAAFHGPHWLTGGAVGPEASVLTPIALLVVALIFSRYYPENRYQISETRSSLPARLRRAAG